MITNAFLDDEAEQLAINAGIREEMELAVQEALALRTKASNHMVLWAKRIRHNSIGFCDIGIVGLAGGCSIESENGWFAVVVSGVLPAEEKNVEAFLSQLWADCKWPGDYELPPHP